MEGVSRRLTNDDTADFQIVEGKDPSLIASLFFTAPALWKRSRE
jgi:hypothetical protein